MECHYCCWPVYTIILPNNIRDAIKNLLAVCKFSFLQRIELYSSINIIFASPRALLVLCDVKIVIADAYVETVAIPCAYLFQDFVSSCFLLLLTTSTSFERYSPPNVLRLYVLSLHINRYYQFGVLDNGSLFTRFE